MQRGHGPNERRKGEPLLRSGGMLPREILKTRLSENVCFAF